MAEGWCFREGTSNRSCNFESGNATERGLSGLGAAVTRSAQLRVPIKMAAGFQELWPHLNPA